MVTIIDPFEDYVSTLKSCFDFDALKNFAKRPGFSILFDGMHGAGGPFAKKVLIEELGLPEVRPSEVRNIGIDTKDSTNCLTYVR
jgi:phosphoglucomutase